MSFYKLFQDKLTFLYFKATYVLIRRSISLESDLREFFDCLHIDPDLVEFSEIRWYEDFINLCARSLVMSKLIHCNRPFLSWYSKIFLQHLLNLILFLYFVKLIRKHFFLSRSLINKFSISTNPTCEHLECKCLVYLHFPRNLDFYVNNIQSDRHEHISSNKCINHIKFKAFVGSNLIFPQRVSPFKFILDLFNFLRCFVPHSLFIYRKGSLPYLFALISTFLYFPVFKVYTNFAKLLWSRFKPKSFLSFESWELTRAFYLYTKRSNLSCKVITLYHFTCYGNQSIIRRSSDLLLVPNMHMVQSFSRLHSNVQMYVHPSLNNRACRARPVDLDKKILLFISTCPFQGVTSSVLRTSLSLTLVIAKALNLRVLFRAHPSMTLNDMKNIYGHLLNAVEVSDNRTALDESVFNSLFVSIAISTSIDYVLPNGRVAFCVGFDKYLPLFELDGCSIKKSLGILANNYTNMILSLLSIASESIENYNYLWSNQYLSYLDMQAPSPDHRPADITLI